MSNATAAGGPTLPGGEGKFYYAGGKKIPLTVSTRFMAVKPTEESTEAVAAALGVAQGLSSDTAPVEVVRIPEYNIALLKVTGARQSTGVSAMRAAVESNENVTAGPPVYETANGDAAVIPVGEIILKFRASLGKEARQRLLDKYNLEVRKVDHPEPGAYVVTPREDVDLVDMANTLHEDEQIEFAEPNFVHVVARPAYGTSVVLQPDSATAEPRVDEGPLLAATDPAFASQWNLKKTNAPEAWDITTGNSGISVAVIDEGCDISHEDISYKLPGYDAYALDDNPTPNGNDAHGTACAGVVAMRMNNGKGGVGIAPGCRVVPIRIAQGIGGGFWSTTSAKVADGIRKAVDAPRSADVLSNSYGVGASTVVENAFKYAQTNGRGGKGCPIAAAAGNSNAPPVIYPASLSPSIPGFMAVSATNEWDQRKSTTSLDGETWWGSSYGPEVDIAAPGVHIYTSDITGPAGYNPSGNYVPNFNGTSSATPHVAGLMALVLSVDGDLRSWEVEEIIKMTANDLGPAGRDQEFGFGRINCRRALEAASRLWIDFAVVPEFLGQGGDCYIRTNIRIYNPGINTVRIDQLTMTSHGPGGAEIDRFEYRPNPGSVLAPRSGQDVRLNRVLLRANGTQSSWSYQWNANWNYTFWRPSAPGLPLSPMDTQSSGTQAVNRATGTASGGRPASRETAPGANESNAAAPASDSISVDRQSRSITIVIR